MTGVCSYCGRIYLTTDEDATVCRTRHDDGRGGMYSCHNQFCSVDCYERHLMEKEG